MKTLSYSEGIKYIESFEPGQIDAIENEWVDGLEICYIFPLDELVLINSKDSTVEIHKSYYDFERRIVDKKHYEKVNLWQDVYVYPESLNFNYIINKNRLLHLDENKELFILKLAKLLEVDISIDSIGSKNEILQINRKINYYLKSDKNYLEKIEIPLLVYLGEYLSKSSDNVWEIREAYNRLDNRFFVPYIRFKANNKTFESAKTLYELIYKMPNKSEEYVFDAVDFVSYAKSVRNVHFNITKQNDKSF